MVVRTRSGLHQTLEYLEPVTRDVSALRHIEKGQHPHLGGEGVEAGVRDGAPLHHQTLDPAAALRTQAAHASVRDFVPEGAANFELLQCRLPESE